MVGGFGVVLSIGKLAVGQARYYLDQAAGRIDRATSVASGVEDYYLAGVEAAGEWLGRGSLAMGLAGKVDDGPLHAVLAGQSRSSSTASTQRSASWGLPQAGKAPVRTCR